MSGSSTTLPVPDGEIAVRVVRAAVAAAGRRHPGIVTEAVVAALLEQYDLTPREPWHRERRRNHEERVRRFSHEVYRILEDADGRDPAEEIAARVEKAFILSPKRRPPAGNAPLEP